jgi:hypothetical protein
VTNSTPRINPSSANTKNTHPQQNKNPLPPPNSKPSYFRGTAKLPIVSGQDTEK